MANDLRHLVPNIMDLSRQIGSNYSHLHGVLKGTIGCSAKSGWIVIQGKGRFPCNMHPELAGQICNDEVLEILDRHAEETAAALAAAKAAK